MSWMNGEFCLSCTKQQCVRSGAERQCAASCATTTQARAARTETHCYARKCTTRRTTVARARAQRQAGMALRSKAGAQTNPGKNSSHSNALRCAQVHHPPDNGGASTRCTLAELQAPLKERLASEKATYDATVAVRAERKHQRQPVLQHTVLDAGALRASALRAVQPQRARARAHTMTRCAARWHWRATRRCASGGAATTAAWRTGICCRSLLLPPSLGLRRANSIKTA